MKLLMCDECGDIFNLQMVVKSCSCGHTVGRYIDNERAEVNGNGYSLAIGNGSLYKGIVRGVDLKEDPRPFELKDDGSILCWARPHTGPANPHTIVNPDLKGS